MFKKSCERVKFFAPCYLIGNKQDRPLKSVKIIVLFVHGKLPS